MAQSTRLSWLKPATAEGEALASKIAGLLIEHRDKCESHTAGRIRLWEDMKESDAVNEEGTRNPASSLAYGHEDQERSKPFSVEVSGEPVPFISADIRPASVQKRAEWIMKHGEELASQHARI